MLEIIPQPSIICLYYRDNIFALELWLPARVEVDQDIFPAAVDHQLTILAGVKFVYLLIPL
jgi:hypothetical protein